MPMLDIKLISTQELLNARHSTSWYGEDYRPEPEKTHTFCRLGKGGVNTWVTITETELYAELAVREHRPNKREGLILRRLQSKHGLTKEEVYAKHRKEFFPKNREQVTSERYNYLVKVYGSKRAAQRYEVK